MLSRPTRKSPRRRPAKPKPRGSPKRSGGSTSWPSASACCRRWSSAPSLSERQVQRHIADLEGAGFLKRIERTRSRRGKISNEYDLSGLVEKLRLLEPQFREVAEEAKARKKAVSTPGYKPTKVKAAAA